MKKVLIVLVCLACITVIPMASWAGGNHHYTNGVEGIKGASVGPSGFYYRMYNVFYDADSIMDKNGNEQNLGFDIKVFAMANRFLWVSDTKILGADFFMDATIPLVNTDLNISTYNLDNEEFGLGDINVEPFGLSWHGDRYDLSFGLSVYLPTGDYDRTKPASPGKGYWTYMTTLGGTLYLDQAKTWSASLLGRYEIHSDREYDDFTPGDDFHFEWGIGKSFARIWEAGFAGYCQWQVNDDKGNNAAPGNVHDRVYAVGPEINVFIPQLKGLVNLRCLNEFGAVDRSEGMVTTLTFTKIF